MKLMNIWALVHNHRMAVSHRECQDGPKTTARNVSNEIAVEAIYVVDVAISVKSRGLLYGTDLISFKSFCDIIFSLMRKICYTQYINYKKTSAAR